MVANKEGFNFREQGRTTPRIDGKPGAPEEAVWNHDEIIRNNVLAANRDAQTWGWFDVSDERHWPRALQEKKPDAGEATQNNAKDYAARDATGQPKNLSLEKLRLTFTNNLYDSPDGQPLMVWGTAWRRHKTYQSIADVRRELGLETGSIRAPFVFQDYLTRDFRVSPDSPALRRGCYPQGEIPGVRLGVIK